MVFKVGHLSFIHSYKDGRQCFSRYSVNCECHSEEYFHLSISSIYEQGCLFTIVEAQAFNPALARKKQEDLYEFQDCLIYTVGLLIL